MSGEQAKLLLLGHVRAVKALRDQRREINADIAERKKEMRDQGFDARRVEDVVRWMEQCEKHGRETVDEAEAMFELYRGVVESEGKPVEQLMGSERDRELLARFAPQDQQQVKGPTRKQRAVHDALAAAACNRAMRDPGRDPGRVPG